MWRNAVWEGIRGNQAHNHIDSRVNVVKRRREGIGGYLSPGDWHQRHQMHPTWQGAPGGGIAGGLSPAARRELLVQSQGGTVSENPTPPPPLDSPPGG